MGFNEDMPGMGLMFKTLKRKQRDGKAWEDKPNEQGMLQRLLV